MRTEEKRVIEVDNYEYRVIVEALSHRRNEFIEDRLPTEDVSDVLLKVIDSPVKKKKDKDYER